MHGKYFIPFLIQVQEARTTQLQHPSLQMFYSHQTLTADIYESVPSELWCPGRAIAGRHLCLCRKPGQASNHLLLLFLSLTVFSLTLSLNDTGEEVSCQLKIITYY